MSNDMKSFALILLIFGCIVLNATKVDATFCVVADVQQAFESADAVFLGELLEIKEPRNRSEHAKPADRFFTVRFKVIKAWKGISFAQSEVSVLWAGTGWESPLMLLESQRYLVYADPFGNSNARIINGCGSRTAVVQVGRMSQGTLLGDDSGDPFDDMKNLDVLTGRTFKFDFGKPRTKAAERYWKIFP